MMQRSILENPVFLLGAPRSGTSFVGHLFRVHPRVAYLGEPRLVWRYGNESRSDMLRAIDARPAVRQYVRNTFERMAAPGREQLVEKTPQNALRLPFVETIFPDCRFIHMIRDGREAVPSILRNWRRFARGMPREAFSRRFRSVRPVDIPHYTREFVRRMAPRSFDRLVGRSVWGPELPGMQALLAELDLLEVCCLQWRMCVEAACAYGRGLPESRYREVRLESLDRREIAELLAFAGLNESEEVWQHFTKHFRPEIAHRSRVTLSETERTQADAWIKPTQAWLGYE